MKTYYKRVQFWILCRFGPIGELINRPQTDWMNEEDVTEELLNSLEEIARRAGGELYKMEKYIEIGTEENKK